MKIETNIKSLPILILLGLAAWVFFYFAGEAVGTFVYNLMN